MFMSVLCFTLGSDESVNVPWVSNFIGVSATSLGGHTDLNGTMSDEAAMAAMEVNMVRSAACADERVGCSQGDIQVGFPPLFLRFSIGKCRNCPFFRAFY